MVEKFLSFFFEASELRILMKNKKRKSESKLHPLTVRSHRATVAPALSRSQSVSTSWQAGPMVMTTVFFCFFLEMKRRVGVEREDKRDEGGRTLRLGPPLKREIGR